MDPLIDLAPGAEDNSLAVRIAERIRTNIALKPTKGRGFRALRGTVQIIPEDVYLPITLRFDLGRLTVHDGAIGVPTVTVAGPLEALLHLFDLPLLPGIPRPFRSSRGAPTGSIVGKLADGGVKVYGLLAHPRMLTRLARLLSRRA